MVFNILLFCLKGYPETLIQRSHIEVILSSQNGVTDFNYFLL